MNKESGELHWSPRYLLGLTLAVGGCNGVHWLDGYWLIGTGIVYLLGLAISWYRESQSILRWIVILLPMVIFGAVFTVAKNHAVRTPVIWTFPERFDGIAYVFLKEKCGDPERKQDQMREYTIPDSGILFSRHGKNFGTNLRDDLFFLRQTGGVSRRLPVLTVQSPDTLHGVFPGEMTVVSLLDGSKAFMEYCFVGTRAQWQLFMGNKDISSAAERTAIASLEKHRATCKE